MANLVVIGSQWGDEGKGKIVNILAHDADVIVRYQGGSNAGHACSSESQCPGSSCDCTVDGSRGVSEKSAVLKKAHEIAACHVMSGGGTPYL